jgi:hypothetical protein
MKHGAKRGAMRVSVRSALSDLFAVAPLAAAICDKPALR